MSLVVLCSAFFFDGFLRRRPVQVWVQDCGWLGFLARKCHFKNQTTASSIVMESTIDPSLLFGLFAVVAIIPGV